MTYSPLLPIHIAGGILGVLSGAAALSFRKGSRGHVLAGKVFVATMLTLASTGVYLAVARSKTGDIFGGLLTFYLVVTAWVTARRRETNPGILDFAALLFALALVATTATLAVQAANSPDGQRFGYEPGVYIFLGSIATVAAAGDIRMLIRHGISGTQRIARHLWRMCFALFIASASIFLARQHLFPAILRTTGVLLLLSFAPLILMAFWLIRVRMKKHAPRFRAAPWPTEPHARRPSEA
jgi:Predicted membrane protein (DUF2306)